MHSIMAYVRCKHLASSHACFGLLARIRGLEHIIESMHVGRNGISRVIRGA